MNFLHCLEMLIILYDFTTKHHCFDRNVEFRASLHCFFVFLKYLIHLEFHLIKSLVIKVFAIFFFTRDKVSHNERVRSLVATFDHNAFSTKCTALLDIGIKLLYIDCVLRQWLLLWYHKLSRKFDSFFVEISKVGT